MKNAFNKLIALILMFSGTIGFAGAQHITVSSYTGQTQIRASGSVTLTDGFYAPVGSKLRVFTGQSYQNCLPLSAVPSSNQNYVLSKTFKVAGVTAVNLNAARSVCEENQVVQYFDGLGRPLQTVDVQASPSGSDIVQPTAYDGFGREAVKYLPYSVSGNAGSYRADALQPGGQPGFYNTPPVGVVQTPRPFSLTVFEASPLNRILEQGTPGEAWQPLPNSSSGHTRKTEYTANAAAEVLLWTINAGDNGATAGSYAAGTLYKTVSRDENWTDGHEHSTEEFKDLEGRVVLRRTWESGTRSLSTYYVYDDLGNLRYVLPPAVNENGKAGYANTVGFTEADPVFHHFIYGYHYDGRKRVSEKKIPEKGWEYIVYNKLDQAVMVQDAVQRSKSPQEWTFTKYDAFGRAVLIGRYIDDLHNGEAETSYRSYFQGLAEGAAAYERRDAANTQTGYSNDAIPQGSIGDYYVMNYYDDYDFPGNSFGSPTGGQAPKERVKSLPTGTLVKDLGTGQMLLTVSYYDLEGRVVQVRSANHLNGTDVIDNTYNFAGELTNSQRTHMGNGTTTIIDNRYEYDHMGRKLSTFENINNQGEVALSHLSYNEIGQLRTKGLHNDVQQTTFAYNERGWLKNSVSNEFSMQLSYNDGTVPQFNGNIAAQYWGAGGSLPNYFSYGYDKLDRLESAISPGLGISELVSYDVMGNINTLNRDGTGANQYNYLNGGNQLGSVSNLTGAYGYDANGNAVIDGRNGMSLTYNYLNLPVTATKPNVSVAYSYNASGARLGKVSTVNGLTTSRQYVNGIEYRPDGTIDIIHTEEGVAQNNGGTYTYHYNLGDHLGNVRYTFDIYAGAVRRLQADDYYAFGKRRVAVPGSIDNKYLYNGKEVQDELQEQYDYGARFYDPVIGRWNVVDPLAEKDRKTSPYTYVFNNPMRFIDPDGMEGTSTHTDKFGKVLQVYDDGDLGVYKHNDAQTTADIDQLPQTSTSRGGEKMGETLMWDSFTEFDGSGKPAGQIDFGSFQARGWLDRFSNAIEGATDNLGNYLGRMHYALNGGGNDIYDYKTQNGGGLYAGSQISEGIYVSARDVGNFAAGRAAAITGQSKMDFMLTAGGFNLSGNSKLGIAFRTSHWQDAARKWGYPTFGEAGGSNFFQRLGYENVRTSQGMKANYKRIWDLK